ncbi:DUF6541 family protein [Leucobacter sp.]
MSWVAFIAPAAASLALIAILGLPVSFALRLRGFAVAVVAVPAAFAVMAVSSIVAPVVGVSWSLLPPLAVTVLLSAVLWLLRGRLGASERIRNRASAAAQRRDLFVSLGAAAIGGAVIALSLVVGLGRGDVISQTFDAGFHLNAVRYILDSGSASPLTVDLTSPGTPVFYPVLWHGFVALLVQLTGASIPLATNAALVAVSAVVWPLGALALGRAVAGPSARVALITGALVAAFPNFPLFLAGYGVIYPNLLALALLPYLLVAGLQTLNLGPARRSMPLSRGTRWLLLLGALGAAVLAHPNVIHAALIWGAVPVLWAAVRALRGAPVPDAGGLLAMPSRPPALRRGSAVLGLVLFAAATLAAWIGGRTADNVWQGFYGFRAALLQLLDGTPHLEGSAWTVSLLVLLGVVIAWRHPRLRWLIGSAAALAFFYYIADGFHTAEWRTLFLSPWYNDPRRLASLVPFGALPLAVLGASAAWTMLRPGLRRLAAARATHPRRARRALTAWALLLLVAAGQAGTLTALQIVRDSYQEPAPLLSDDELRLLERLDDVVPEGERILNNPLNGSALGYALADRDVVFPHAGGRYDQRGYELVDSIVDDPARACELADALDVGFVLDFGMDYVLDSDTRRGVPFRHMQELDRSPILAEADREGDAVLYRVDCE